MRMATHARKWKRRRVECAVVAVQRDFSGLLWYCIGPLGRLIHSNKNEQMSLISMVSFFRAMLECHNVCQRRGQECLR